MHTRAHKPVQSDKIRIRRVEASACSTKKTKHKNKKNPTTSSSWTTDGLLATLVAVLAFGDNALPPKVLGPLPLVTSAPIVSVPKRH